MSSWPAQQGALCLSPKWIMNRIYSALRRLAFLSETDMTKSCLFHLLKDKLMPGCCSVYPTFLCGSQQQQREPVLGGGSQARPMVRHQGYQQPMDISLPRPWGSFAGHSYPEAPALDIIFCWPNKLIISAKWQVFIFILNKIISLQKHKNNFQCHVYFSQA